MKDFTDRLFYCEDTDALAHVQYIAPQRWALSMLRQIGETPLWDWRAEAMTETYEQAHAMLGRQNPVLLVQEMGLA